MRHFFILFILGLLLTGCKDDEDNNHYEQVKEKCSDPVIVEIDGFKLNIPRDVYKVHKNGKVIYELYRNRHCDIEFIDDVDAVTSAHKFGIYSSKHPVETSYKQHRSWIDKYGLSKKTLKNNTQKFYTEVKEFYILPESTSPTKNKEPVLFSCLQTEEKRKQGGYVGSCYAHYQLPNGLLISYSVSRKHYSENDLIQADQKMRQKVKQLITKFPNGEERK